MAEDDVAVARHAEAAAGALRQLGEGIGVFRRVQVGAADAAGAGADQHLALGEHGSGIVSTTKSPWRKTAARMMVSSGFAGE